MDRSGTPRSVLGGEPALSDGVARRTVLLGGLAAASLPTGACAIRSGGFRYRLTLEIDSFGRRLVGSSVQGAVSYAGTTELGSRKPTSGGLVGEGAVVDLGTRGVVVSTFLSVLETQDPKGFPEPGGRRLIVKHDWDIVAPFGRGLALPTRPDTTVAAAWTDALSNMKTSAVFDVEPGELPLLVHFPDRNDPAGVRWLNPFSGDEGLALRKATLQIVSDPLTRGAIEKALPWADGYRKKSFALSGQMGTPPNRSLAETVRVTNFWRSRR